MAMPMAMQDPLASSPPSEGDSTGGDDEGGSQEEAWSPFGEGTESEARKAPTPCNSPVDNGVALGDNWGWLDCPEENDKTVNPPETPPRDSGPQRDPIARTLFPVAMTTGPDSLLVTAFAQQTGRTWTGALALHDLSCPSDPVLLASRDLPVTPSSLTLRDCGLLVAFDDGALQHMTLKKGDGQCQLGYVIQERCEHDAPIVSLDVSQGGTRAFTCDATGCVCVWNPLEVLVNLARWPGVAVSAVTAHPSLERLFATAGGARVKLWEETQVVRSLLLAEDSRRITNLQWVTTNALLIGWSDGGFQLVDLRQSECPVWSSAGGDRGREVLDVTAVTSNIFAAISADNHLCVVDAGKEVGRFPLSGGELWEGRCEEKLVTSLTSMPGRALACCRDQTWWTWGEDCEKAEHLTLPLVRPQDEK